MRECDEVVGHHLADLGSHRLNPDVPDVELNMCLSLVSMMST